MNQVTHCFWEATSFWPPPVDSDVVLTSFSRFEKTATYTNVIAYKSHLVTIFRPMPFSTHVQ